MIIVEEYIVLDKETRQEHLKLDDACLERGGNSTNFKGLLAHILNTTIPKGREISLCHACHNEKCSNPNHLYWGTISENSQDYVENGGKSVWDRMVEKYGEDGAREMNRRNSNPSKAGSGNKGKPKSEEHRRKISEALKASKTK